MRRQLARGGPTDVAELVKDPLDAKEFLRALSEERRLRDGYDDDAADASGLA